MYNLRRVVVLPKETFCRTLPEINMRIILSRVVFFHLDIRRVKARLAWEYFSSNTLDVTTKSLVICGVKSPKVISCLGGRTPYLNDQKNRWSAGRVHRSSAFIDSVFQAIHQAYCREKSHFGQPSGPSMSHRRKKQMTDKFLAYLLVKRLSGLSGIFLTSF